MFVDYVFPSENEEKFIGLAPKLGYSGLCFIYQYDKNIIKYEEKIKKLQKKTKLNISYGFIVSLRDINKIKKTKNLVFIKGSDKNRFVVEQKRADVLFSLEEQNREDFMHHRASGLNHVLCGLASKNKVVIGFSFNMLLKNKKKLYVILGRLIQNRRLCRKYKIKTLIGSFAEKPFEMRNVKDIMGLFVMIGMYEDDIKKSLTSNTEKTTKIRENAKTFQ